MPKTPEITIHQLATIKVGDTELVLLFYPEPHQFEVQWDTGDGKGMCQLFETPRLQTAVDCYTEELKRQIAQLPLLSLVQQVTSKVAA